MAIPTDEELLAIFWDESYPGGSDSPLAEEPKWVYTDHEYGVAAVRKAVIEGLAEEVDGESFAYHGDGDVIAEWLRSHL